MKTARFRRATLCAFLPLAALIACKSNKPKNVAAGAATSTNELSHTTSGAAATAQGPALLAALQGFTARVEHLAGKGGELPDGESAWRDEYEGAQAQEVGFSQPYCATQDASGNLLVADKNGHAIRKVFPDGHLETIAGTQQSGDGGDASAKANTIALASPNGLVTRPDGTTYILDKDNAKIRKLTPDGNISTLATLTEKIESGRGLWVSPDESKAYVSSKERLLGWSAKDGTTVVATGFSSLANLAVAPDGTIFATDRGAHLVLQIAADGKVTTIAGNGDTQGGKSGDLGTKIGLAGARGLARAKDGSLWVGTQEARTIWWISPDLHAYKIIDGLTGKAAILTEPELLGPIRCVALTDKHQLLIVHGNGGQVHRVELPDLASTQPQ